MAKWVAVVEISENIDRYATKNMSFSLSKNSYSSEVFKYIFFNKVEGMSEKLLRGLQCSCLSSTETN